MESGTSELPDVFLTSRTDLRWLLDQELTQPVDELLDERGSTSATATPATPSRRSVPTPGCSACRTACPRWSSTTTSGLVNFDRMRKRVSTRPSRRDVVVVRPVRGGGEFASRAARGTKGVHVDATLPGLAPFIESGGGSVFDDGTDPTSLSFASDDSQAALERTLEVLRDRRSPSTSGSRRSSRR